MLFASTARTATTTRTRTRTKTRTKTTMNRKKREKKNQQNNEIESWNLSYRWCDDIDWFKNLDQIIIIIECVVNILMELFFGFRSMDCQTDQHIFISFFSPILPIRLCSLYSISLMQPTEVCVVFISFIHKQSTCICIRCSILSVEFVYMVYVLQSIQINVFLRLILFECLFSGHTNHEKKNRQRIEKKKKKRDTETNGRKKKCKKEKLKQQNPCDKSEWYYCTNGKHNPIHLDLQ